MKTLNKIFFAILSSIVFFIASYIAQYLVIKNLTVVDYGVFALVNNVTSIISYTITIVANGLLLDIKLTKDKTQRNDYLNKVLILIMMLGIVITFPIFLVYSNSMRLGFTENLILFIFVFFNTTLSTWITVFTSYLIGQLKFKQQLITTLINSVIKLSSFGLLSFFFGLWGSIAAFIIAPVFTTFGLIIKYRKSVIKFFSYVSIKTLFDRPDNSVLIRFLRIVFVVFITQADILIVNIVTKDPLQAGLYAQLSLILKMPIMLGIPIIQTYLPLLANQKLKAPSYFFPLLLGMFSAALLVLLNIKELHFLLPFDPTQTNQTVLILGLITNYLSVCLLYQTQLHDLKKQSTSYDYYPLVISIVYFVSSYFGVFTNLEYALLIWILILIAMLVLEYVHCNLPSNKSVKVIGKFIILLGIVTSLYLIVGKVYQSNLRYFYPDSFMYYELSTTGDLSLFMKSLFRIQYELRVLPVYFLKLAEFWISPMQANLLMNVISTLGSFILVLQYIMKNASNKATKLLLAASSSLFLITPFLMNIDSFTVFILILNLYFLNSSNRTMKVIALTLLGLTRIELMIPFVALYLLQKEWKTLILPSLLVLVILSPHITSIPILISSLTHAKYFLLAFAIILGGVLLLIIRKYIKINKEILLKIVFSTLFLLGLLGAIETITGQGILNYINIYPPLTYFPLLLAKFSLPLTTTVLLFNIQIKKEYIILIIYMSVIYFVITSRNVRYFFLIEPVVLFALLQSWNNKVKSEEIYKTIVIWTFAMFNLVFIVQPSFIKWNEELNREIKTLSNINNEIVYSKNNLGLKYLGNKNNEYRQLGYYNTSGYWQCDIPTSSDINSIIIVSPNDYKECEDKFKSINNEKVLIIKN